ncbi:MAG: Carbohydrate diacid regulator [Firmicutes bacterium ADurb.Bin193]|nr:MAG: Carbohydrate diacid regulator [Firmicutes bacterium ADurb.Bin193]
MTVRLFQTVIHQMQSALGGRKAGVMDDAGNIVACTEVTMVGIVWSDAAEIARETADIYTKNGKTFRRLGGRSRLDYIVFCDGEDDCAHGFVGLICITLTQLKLYYDEKYDKISFVKNILIDNIMVSDIYPKAKALYLNTDVNRVAFLIRTYGDEYSAHEVISGLFPDKNKDFVISINETDVVLIKEVKEGTTIKDLDKLANSIVDTLRAELMTNIKVGIGSIVSTISEIGHSYKDAVVALEVGKVFDTERAIISYNNLGIGRLIYQLPTKMCELFLSEVFKKGSLELLDNETIVTIQKFFENNLNVSEASRQLFVHRNTLVYRLDKIYKLTGLDLRKFDDAIVFKVAMMVSRYLKSGEINI